MSFTVQSGITQIFIQILFLFELHATAGGLIVWVLHTLQIMMCNGVSVSIGDNQLNIDGIMMGSHDDFLAQMMPGILLKLSVCSLLSILNSWMSTAPSTTQIISFS